MTSLSHLAAARHAAAAPAIGPAVIIVIVLALACRFAFGRDGKGTPAGRALAVALGLAVPGEAAGRLAGKG